MGSHADAEVGVGERRVFAEGVLEGDEVEGGDVVAVGFVGGFRHGPAFALKPEAEEVLSELNFGGQIVGIENERLALMRRALGEAVFLGKFFADEMVDVRIPFPKGESLVTGDFLGGFVLAQVGDEAAVSPHLGMARVDLVGVVELLLRIGVCLAVDKMIGEQQSAADVVGVDVQRRLQVLRHDFPVRGRKRAGGTEVQRGIFRMLFERLLKGAPGEFVIVFRESEFANGDGGFGVVWVVRSRGAVKFLEHELRVSAEL